MNSDLIMQAVNICKSYRKGVSLTRVLKGISLDLHRSEVVALVGESGSGKSTFGKLILGLESADAGHFLLNGQPLDYRFQSRRDMRRAVQMIFQDPFASLNPVHKIRYCLERAYANLSGQPAEKASQRLAAVLSSVGLDPGETIDKYPHELSGGQRQRVAIARALLCHPQVLVADEPTSMLDVSLRLGVLKLLREQTEKHGMAMLFITHDLASARYIANRIMVIEKGEIVSNGPSEDIIQRPDHPYTRKLIQSISDPKRNRPLEAASVQTGDLGFRPATAVLRQNSELMQENRLGDRGV